MIFLITVLLGVAGGLGALSRFILDGLIRTRSTAALPISTIVINVSGSLLLGFLVGLVSTGRLPVGAETVLGAGFLGGYTTFSTANVETVRLVRDGRIGRGLVNALGTLLLTVAAAAAGMLLGQLL